MTKRLKAAETYTHTHTHTHTHTCNPCLAKFLAFGLATIFPLFSSIADTPTPDIGASDSTANCDSGVLHSTTGPTAFQAEWGANTININWYADGDATTPMNVTNSAATTCTYDGAITLPENTMTKTGYTFAGWQVRVPFDLSTLDTSTPGSATGYSRLNGNEGFKISEYGLIWQRGEWAVEFDYGTVKGIAKCSAKSGDDSRDWTATESELNSTSGEEQYCWCKATAFDADKDAVYVDVTTAGSPKWVFANDDNNMVRCREVCTIHCSSRIKNVSDFRTALYNLN